MVDTAGGDAEDVVEAQRADDDSEHTDSEHTERSDANETLLSVSPAVLLCLDSASSQLRTRRPSRQPAQDPRAIPRPRESPEPAPPLLPGDECIARSALPPTCLTSVLVCLPRRNVEASVIVANLRSGVVESGVVRWEALPRAFKAGWTHSDRVRGLPGGVQRGRSLDCRASGLSSGTGRIENVGVCFLDFPLMPLAAPFLADFTQVVLGRRTHPPCRGGRASAVYTADSSSGAPASQGRSHVRGRSSLS